MTKSKAIAYYAISFSLIIVSMFLDRMLSMWLPVSFAIITSVIVLSLCILRDNLLSAFITGLLMGLASLIVAVAIPSASSELFINPLISILPRSLIGLVVFGVYKLAIKLFNGKTVVCLSLCALFGAVSNTVFTLSAMTLFGGYALTGEVIKGLVLFNALPEVIASVILVPLLVIPVRKATKLGVNV